MRPKAPSSALRNERGKAAVIILAVVAIAAVAFAVYWFALRGGGSGESSKLVTAHIPADAELIGGLDVQSIMKSDFAKGMLPSLPGGMSLDDVKAELTKRGINIDDLQTMAFGMSGVGTGNPEVVTVAKGTFDANAIKSAIDLLAKAAAEPMGSELGGFDPGSIQVLDSGVMIGGAGALVEKAIALSKGSGKSAADNPALKQLRGHIDEGASFWMVGAIPDSLPMGGALSGMSMLGGDMGTPTHFGVSAEIGSELEISFAVHFDAGDAGKLASSIDGMLGLAKMAVDGPQADLLDSLSVSGSGSVLSASFSMSPALVKELAEQRGGGGMGLF